VTNCQNNDHGFFHIEDYSVITHPKSVWPQLRIYQRFGEIQRLFVLTPIIEFINDSFSDWFIKPDKLALRFLCETPLPTHIILTDFLFAWNWLCRKFWTRQ